METILGEEAVYQRRGAEIEQCCDYSEVVAGLHERSTNPEERSIEETEGSATAAKMQQRIYVREG